MKTLLSLISVMLFMVACNKSIDRLPELKSTNVTKSVTTYYLDTTYKFRSESIDDMPFDSCTNEYVSLHGKIHYGYLILVEDSVKIKDSSWIHYDSVYGLGVNTGTHYKYHYDITSKQTDIWRDSCYFQTRNYWQSRIRLATKGIDNDFVVTGYIKILAERNGNILYDSINYNYGECK